MPDRWHTVTFRIDPVTNTYRFLFDGVEPLTVDSLDFRGAPAKFDSIAFIPQVSGSGIFVDAIQVFTGASTPGVLAKDVNLDELATTVEQVAGPSHAAAFELHPDGTFVYTPQAGFLETDSFEYRISDAFGNSDPATVFIRVGVPSLPGDVNGDGNVDLSDFSTLKQNFGVRPAGYAEGNLNDDDVVDLGDFSILKGYFGASFSPVDALAVAHTSLRSN